MFAECALILQTHGNVPKYADSILRANSFQNKRMQPWGVVDTQHRSTKYDSSSASHGFQGGAVCVCVSQNGESRLHLQSVVDETPMRSVVPVCSSLDIVFACNRTTEPVRRTTVLRMACLLSTRLHVPGPSAYIPRSPLSRELNVSQTLVHAVVCNQERKPCLAHVRDCA